MANMEIPSRWDFEVRVMTPDHQVLTNRATYSPDYMDKSLMEYLLGKLSAQAIDSIKDRGYLD